MKNDRYNDVLDIINSKGLVLASQSPRRAQLLKLMGLEFRIKPSDFDEESITTREPAKNVVELSLAKAQKVADSAENGLVIGADTIVVLNGEILGKPKDKQDAFNMLTRLSGNTHEVYTGYAIVEKPGNRAVSGYDVTHVHFRPLKKWEIEGYINTSSPFDKAGSYGIQDQSAVFADRIEGCFYNVVGFPVSKFYSTLLTMLDLNYDE